MDEKLELLNDKNFIVSSKWVYENDEDTFNFLLDCLKEWADSPNNMTNEEDIQDFENGNWLVEYSFHKNGFDDLVMQVWTGTTIQNLANEPEWMTAYLNNVTMNAYEVDKYLEVINEQN